MSNPNFYEVWQSLANDLAQVPGVRSVVTRDFTPSDIPAHQTPAIGISEESIAEAHLVGRRRRCTLTLALMVVVQGETESRARELRDEMRRNVNWWIQQNTEREGWAVYTDETPQWEIGVGEDPRMLTLTRSVQIYWIELCDER